VGKPLDKASGEIDFEHGIESYFRRKTVYVKYKA
jgi:hypothetical protein